MRNKLGQFKEVSAEDEQKEKEKEEEEEQAAKAITVGCRCAVNVSGALPKRGQVKFVGTVCPATDSHSDTSLLLPTPSPPPPPPPPHTDSLIENFPVTSPFDCDHHHHHQSALQSTSSCCYRHRYCRLLSLGAGITRTRCSTNFADMIMFPKMHTRFVMHTTFAAEVNFVSRTANIVSENLQKHFLLSVWHATMLPCFATDGQYRRTHLCHHNMSLFWLVDL